MNEQVTHLALSIPNEIEAMEETDQCSSDAFQLVLSLYRGLINLSFYQSNLCLNHDYHLGRLPSSCCSSTLTKLDIQVASFADLLLLLDGRFKCLSTCVVSVGEIIQESTMVDNTVSEIHHSPIILILLCCTESTASA